MAKKKLLNTTLSIFAIIFTATLQTIASSLLRKVETDIQNVNGKSVLTHRESQSRESDSKEREGMAEFAERMGKRRRV